MGEPVNDALLDFSRHWKLDGDYLRCLKCKRPQLASYRDYVFLHADGCKNEGKADRHPWKLLTEILTAESGKAGGG